MSIRQIQSEKELLQHLQDHLGFLQASADAYDAGFDGEAKRLAVSIRVLVHDTNRSQSLLGQLGRKTDQFVDSAFAIVPGNKSTHSGLVMTHLSASNGAKYVALLDDVPRNNIRNVSFESWWTSTVFIDAAGASLSRKDLVLAIANQDGGAHVDPSLDQVYANLSRNNSLGWIVSDGTTIRPMEGPESAAVRQIAHELLKSLVNGYTKVPTHPDEGVIVGNFVLLQKPGGTAGSENLCPSTRTIGRNELCSCGSGKKYKRCCGRLG